MPESPILLVSADAELRTAAAHHFRTRGLRAEVAEDEASALDLLCTLKAPVVVLGPWLEETDRAELLRTARSASHRPEVIVMANGPSLDDVIGWRRDGVFAVLGCPPELPDLVQTAEGRTSSPRGA